MGLVLRFKKMPQKPLAYLQVSKKSLTENTFSKDTAGRTTFGGVGGCDKVIS